MALTLLPLLDVDRGAEAGVEAWCGHSLVGSEERRELGRMGEGLSAGGHSEGESLRKGEKKRLGRRSSPQNGRFGGRATSCECSEEQTIDQARILGRPDNSLL